MIFFPFQYVTCQDSYHIHLYKIHVITDLRKVKTERHNLIYRNKESSQTTLETETDGARPEDLKIQMTVNKKINRI